MSSGEIGLGIIGCGGFGLYALQQFVQVPGVKLIGMAGTNRPAAHAAARRFGIPDIEDVDSCWRATTSTWSTSPHRRSFTIRRRWRPSRPASTSSARSRWRSRSSRPTP